MRLIDADKLEDVLAKHQTHYYGDSDYYEGISQGFNLAIYDVKETPTIEAEPTRHGKWIKVGDNTYRCSRCNEVSCCNGNFCTDCGARMEIEDEDMEER